MESQDTLREILYRLPLQDLNNCKSINKECYSLISDPEFDRDKRRVMGDNAIFSAYTYEHDKFEFYGLQCNGYKEVLASPFDDYSNVYQPMVLGSCNGLIGVKYDYCDYLLWNPVTQEYKIYYGRDQPLLIDPTAVGLCYNASKDEYMAVVVGTVRLRFRLMSCIELINFSTNVSKTVNQKLSEEAFELNGVGVVVCGVPHWVKEFKNNDNLPEQKHILYFDTDSETFQEMGLPCHGGTEKRVLGLGALGGQRQLGVVLQDVGNPYKFYDVWVMKEFGNPESWIYRCKIPSMNVRGNCYEFVNLVGLKSGEVWAHYIPSRAESEKLKLMTYDPTNQRFRNVDVSGDKGAVVSVTAYEPTFMSPFSLMDNNWTGCQNDTAEGEKDLTMGYIHLDQNDTAEGEKDLTMGYIHLDQNDIAEGEKDLTMGCIFIWINLLSFLFNVLSSFTKLMSEFNALN